MRATWIIFQRELGHYFSSPLAYLIAFAVLLMTGFSFNNELTRSIGQRAVEPALIPVTLAQLLIIFAPLLTMRLLAEETREGTLELLLTAPVPDYSIVIGKFLSAWAYFTFLLALTLVYQIILAQLGFPDFAHTMSAYMGIWLYAGATLAIGTLFSAMTENQILAAFLSVVTILGLYAGDAIGELVTSIDLAEILRNLTLAGHFSTSFAIGLFRPEDVVYYAGLIVVCLFIAIQLVESRRWR